MNKIIIFLIIISTLLSCKESKLENSSENNKKEIIKQYKDSIALVTKLKKDSIAKLIPYIKIDIYVRKDVTYDSEGWPVEMGKIVKVSGFQEKKEYQSNGYNYVEKIVIKGNSDEISLLFINENNNKILHEEKDISLNGSKIFTTTNPAAEKQKFYCEWMDTRFKTILIKITYKDKNIFVGKIIPSPK